MYRPLSTMFLAGLLLIAAPAHSDDTAGTYVVTLSEAAAAEEARDIAARLANTYGASISEERGSSFVMQVSETRARMLERDPHVATVTPLAAAADAHSLPAANAETMTWSSGVSYSYDGSGNIWKVGTDYYVYDAVNRVVLSETAGVASNYTYDAFGNRKTCTTATADCQNGITINSNTNRIDLASYDQAGRVVSLPGGSHTYTYDAVDMPARDVSPGMIREFVYTADDERLAVYTHNAAGQVWRWTLRDFSGKVLREFASGTLSGTSNWQWTKDYVYRDGLLLASRQPESNGSISTYHYHLDHLGSARRITDDTDNIVGTHDYQAFGPRLSAGRHEPSTTALQFTGHERDAIDGGEQWSTLDYMHARYYSPYLGRFLTIDPEMDPGRNLRVPQRWNRYAYALNNPITRFDPDGLKTGSTWSTLSEQVHSIRDSRLL